MRVWIKGGARSDLDFDRILLAAAGVEAGRTGRRLLLQPRMEMMGAGPGAAVGQREIGLDSG